MQQNVYLKGATTTNAQNLYDRELIISGMEGVNFFTHQRSAGRTSVVGKTSGTKTSADTNMTQSGRVGANMQYRATGLCFAFEAGSDTAGDVFRPAELRDAVEGASNQIGDSRALMAAAHVRLKLGGSDDYIQGSIASFPPNVGLAYAGGGDFLVANPVGQVYEFSEPLIIDDKLDFGVAVDFGGALTLPSGTVGRLTCYFTGYLIKAAQ